MLIKILFCRFVLGFYFSSLELRLGFICCQTESLVKVSVAAVVQEDPGWVQNRIAVVFSLSNQFMVVYVN